MHTGPQAFARGTIGLAINVPGASAVKGLREERPVIIAAVDGKATDNQRSDHVRLSVLLSSRQTIKKEH